MYFITLHLFYFILLTCLGSPHGSRVSCWQVTMISLISWNTRNIPKHLCPQCLFMSSWDLSRPCLLTSGMVAGLSGAHGGRNQVSQPHCEAQDVQQLPFASTCIDHSVVLNSFRSEIFFSKWVLASLRNAAISPSQILIPNYGRLASTRPVLRWSRAKHSHIIGLSKYCQCNAI